METIKLAIIEDNEEILDALNSYLEQQQEIEVVGTEKSIEDFISKYNNIKDIDVLLLDIMLGGMSGIAGIPTLKKIWPTTSIIINSVLEDNENIFNALRLGAVGYLTKETPLENIKNSILQSSQGMSFMNSSIANKIVQFFTSSHKEVKEKLTEKEMQVAEALKNGMSYKIIALENGLSIDTIRFHVRNIYRKLQINSKGELIHLMMKK